MGAMDLSALAFDAQVGREWLVTNGLGGFATSTIPCLNTRKYHGLLVAATSPPVRQMVLLSRVEEFVRAAGRPQPLSSCEYPGVIHPGGQENLRAFSDEPFPRWGYQGEVLAGRSWVPLSGFDLAAHQSANSHVAARGMLGRLARPGERYINLVRFQRA